MDEIVAANARYHDLFAVEYDTEFASCYARSRSRVSEIVDFLAEHTAADLWLDVGTGSGNVLAEVRAKFRRGMGFDVSVGMLREAQKRDLEVTLALAERLPVSDSSADVVSAFSVLHHLFDPIQGLLEMVRVLKPGGYLYTDWDSNCRALYHPLMLRAVWAWRRLRREKPRFRDRSEENRRLYYQAEYHHDLRGGLDPLELSDLLRFAGMNVSVIYYDGCPTSFLGLKYSLRKMLEKALMRFLFTGRIPTLKKSELCHRFAILARKGGSIDPILWTS